MFCINCGKKSESNQKFCTSCGGLLSKNVENNKEAPTIKTTSPVVPFENSWSVGRITTILVILAIVGSGIYGSLDEDSVTKNNKGLTSFDSGDSETAINQLQEASKDAVANNTKLNTLKNLGYVHSSEGQNEQALQSFKEALTYVNKDSFDYFLVSGEVALLEGKPNAAQIAYNKAYQINPNEFQINNALALFYLNLDNVAPQYADYQKALQYAQRANQLTDLQIAKQNLGIAYYFNENYDQAIAMFNSLTSYKDSYTAYWIGLAYAQKDDIVNAKIYLQRAIANGVEVPQEIYNYINSN